MTLDEAKTIARIARTADMGCPYCICGLLEYLAHYFPEFRWYFAGEEVKPADYDLSDDEDEDVTVELKGEKAK